MMDTVAFATKRLTRLEDFAKELRPLVEKALANWSTGVWYGDIVEGAAVLWLETFEKTSKSGNPAGSIDHFIRLINESLAKTSMPSDPPTDGEIDRITRWVGVFAVNNATYRASIEEGSLDKTWVTMNDSDVRSMHMGTNGQTVPIRGTFDVGGYKLLYPGEPVGPPEVWINCRCVVATKAAYDSALNSATVSGTETFAVRPAVGGIMPKVDEEIVAPVPEGMPVDEAPVEDDLTDEEIDDEDLVDDTNEVPWHGVLTVEGVETGDKRRINAGAIQFPEPQHMPAPLMYQEYTDGVPHGSAARIGRIDEMWREDNGEIRARGMLNTGVMEANKAIDGMVFGGASGVSVDLDSAEMELEFPEGFESLEIEQQMAVRPVEVITSSRLRGATMVGFGAFIEGYIDLGSDFEEVAPESAVDEPAPGEDVVDSETVEEDDPEDGSFSVLDKFMAWLETEAGEGVTAAMADEQFSLVASAFAPGTQDGPGWLTNPKATQRLRNYWTKGKGALKIRWGTPGDFNRARRQLSKYINPLYLAGTVANLHKEATGTWPGDHNGRRGKHSGAPSFSLVASAGTLVPRSAFENPNLTEPLPLTVTDDRRVYGYAALFGTCHIGISDRCVMPPSSPSRYSYFLTGMVDTDDGPVRTGVIVMGTGHAGSRANAAKATSHYDNTGYAVADITIGEDGTGIWFAGMLRDDTSDSDIKKLKASTVSGDWRDPSRSGVPNEMVGLLTVNVGGFKVPRPAFGMDGDRQVSLIASAGMLMPRDSEESITAGAATLGWDADDLLRIGRTVADELEYRQERRDRVAAIRDEGLMSLAAERRTARIAAAKSLITEE